MNPTARLWLHRHGHAGGGRTLSGAVGGAGVSAATGSWLGGGGAQAAGTEWQKLVKILED